MNTLLTECTVYRLDLRPLGKKLLLEASEPASVPVVSALVSALVQDERCGALCIVTNTSVDSALAPMLDSLGFTKGVGEDLQTPMDTAVAIVGPVHSPSQLLLRSAKSVFGCTKLFYVTSGLQSTSVNFKDPNFKAQYDPIDAVLVGDDLALRLYESRVSKEVSSVVQVGSILLDALLNEDIQHLREQARKKMNIALQAKVVFFSSFPAYEYVLLGASDSVAIEALRLTVAGVEAAALKSEASMVLIVRSHPRQSDEEKSHIQQLQKLVTPANLQILVDPPFSFDECVQASDILACVPTSTLSMLARYRGQRVVFIAYPEGGADIVLAKLFDTKEQEILSATPGIHIARSPDDVTLALESKETLVPLVPQGHTVEKILSQIL